MCGQTICENVTLNNEKKQANLEKGQISRILIELRDSVKTHGLLPSSLSLGSSARPTIAAYVLKFPGSKCLKYEELSKCDQEKLESLVYLMDKCCLSDHAYRELTELTLLLDGLPKTHL